MKNIKIKLLSILMISTLMLSGCSNDDQVSQAQVMTNVQGVEVKSEKSPMTIDYIGSVDSLKTRKMSFKTGGKISSVYVKKGDYVTKGQKLAELDSKDLSLQLQSLSSRMESSNLDIKKTEENYIYNKDYFEKVETLYQNSGISENDYKKAKMAMESSKLTYEQSLYANEMAARDYEMKSDLYSNSSIYAPENGYVLDIYYESGEFVQGGAPILSINNSKKIVRSGISQKDIQNIKIGKNADLSINGIRTSGKVINISPVPDQNTKTYPVEISLENSGEFYIGSICEVKFNVGESDGIWIPLNSIMSSTIDYVFIYDGSQSLKKTVTIEEVVGSNAKVKGLEEGNILITSGMKSLRNGSLVNLVD